LEYIRKQYNIKKENVFGFGDQLNDYDLFIVNHGAVMINAPDHVKNSERILQVLIMKMMALLSLLIQY